jgi:hypothetical protein
MPLVLQAGLRLVRRDADHLQLGVDPPRRVILRDSPDVRRLVEDLARGLPSGGLSADGTRALAQIVAAGLAHPAERAGTRGRALAQAPVRVVANRHDGAALTDLLSDAGLVPTTERDPAAVLVVAEGEVARGALDPLLRDGVPHLVMTGSAAGFTIGPFVVPGPPPACGAWTPTSGRRTRAGLWSSSRSPPPRRWSRISRMARCDPSPLGGRYATS